MKPHFISVPKKTPVNEVKEEITQTTTVNDDSSATVNDESTEKEQPKKFRFGKRKPKGIKPF